MWRSMRRRSGSASARGGGLQSGQWPGCATRPPAQAAVAAQAHLCPHIVHEGGGALGHGPAVHLQDREVRAAGSVAAGCGRGCAVGWTPGAEAKLESKGGRLNQAGPAALVGLPSLMAQQTRLLLQAFGTALCTDC